MKRVNDIERRIRIKHLKGCIGNKKIVFFGAGEILDLNIGHYESLRSRFKYIIDNDENKWGKWKHGLEVKSPEALESEDRDNTLIIVASRDFIDEIVYQLGEQFGYTRCREILDIDLKLPYLKTLNRDTKILVTCHGEGKGDGGLFLVDVQNDRIEKCLDNDDLLGLCKTDSGFTLIDHESMHFLTDDLKVHKSIDFPFHKTNDFHGIEYSDGVYYLVQTSTNTIKLLDETSLEIIDEINFTTEDEDLHHINDILIENDRLYVSMISLRGLQKKDWVTEENGAILELDKKTLEIKNVIKENLNFPHSIKKFQGQLAYCESFNYSFSDISGEIGKFAGFIRGLEFDGNIYYIGQSSLRSYVPPNAQYISVDTGVHVFDPVFKISRFIKLPAHNVYGIYAI